MISDLEFIKKIHAGGEAIYDENNNKHYCYMAILKDWTHDLSFEERMEAEATECDMFHDRFYTYEEFDQLQDLLDQGAEDTYFSINSFWRTKKSTDDVRHLNAFVLDFDFYKKRKFKNMSPEQFYEFIKDKLPFTPTAAINSGRGLYIIYAFNYCTKVRVPLYRAIYDRFLKSFKKYGMDKQAMNVTQVIRMPGSINTKNLEYVTIIDYNDTNYELTDFAPLLEYSYEEYQVHKEEKKKRVAEKVKKATEFNARSKRKEFFSKLMADAKQLVMLRNKKKQNVGYREYLLFIIRERATWAGYSVEESIQFADQINQLMNDQMLDREVIMQCRPSFRAHVTSVGKIIVNLNLTAEEQEQMQVLREKKYADSKRNKRKRKHMLLNRTEKQIKILKRRQEVFKLKKEGYKNKEIADKLGINKGTVTKDLQYIDEHKREFYPEILQVVKELTEKLADRSFINRITHEAFKSLSDWLSVSVEALE